MIASPRLVLGDVDAVMFMHATPVDADRTMLFWGCAFPHGVEIDDAQYVAIEEAIWAPDRRMVQSQEPAGLPLGRRDELHLPMDRFPIAYRAALSELGVPSSIGAASATSLPATWNESVHA